MESDCTEGGRPVIWALSAGSAGDARQARALARALARRGGARVEERAIALRAPWDRLPAWAWALGGAREGGWPFTGLAAEGDALARPWPDVVVGCGRRTAPLTAALRRLGGVRAVQVLAPQMPLSAFDAVVAPRHDGLSGPNVTATLGALNDLDPETLAHEAARWARRLGHLPHPRVAVLVGGPSGAASFGARALEGLTAGLTRLAVDGAGLMITPSRRTPKAVTERLADALTGLGGWIWGGVGDNPYPGLLGLADAVVVTADSVNLACEAAATGRPVFVAAVDRLDAKLARFHADLAAAGVSRPFDGRMADWRYPPLREAERVAEALAGLRAPA